MPTKSPLNRSLSLSEEEMKLLTKECDSEYSDTYINKIFYNDSFVVMASLPRESYDLIVLDPPYNLNKKFNDLEFKRKSDAEYTEYVSSILRLCKPLLKPNGVIYFCIDWKSSICVYNALQANDFIIHNRIVWEREKGRGSKRNWKNNTEDIYMASLSNDYHFDVDSVKIKRKVLANYKGKDWSEENGKKVRLTYPSNIWTDITIPFWSMPENTPHPTQKPEKLIARLILSTTTEGAVVLDPFGGSGTTGVVAKKLGRNYTIIENQEDYVAYTKYRLDNSNKGDSIQGYEDGVFLDRNFNA